MTEYITVRGFVATAPDTKTLEDGTALASFRLASTPRWFDARSGEWVDGHTNWFTVVGFRALAASISLCVRVGQPVVVQGKLKVKNWEAQGARRSAVEIEAVSLGHDLAFGTSNFTRTSGGAKPAGGASAQEAAPGEDGDTGAGTSWPAPSESVPGPGRGEDLGGDEAGDTDEAFVAMT